MDLISSFGIKQSCRLLFKQLTCFPHQGVWRWVPKAVCFDHFLTINAHAEFEETTFFHLYLYVAFPS